MATYKGIKGVKVQTKAADPTASEADGTVWYNSTSPSALKYSIQSAGAWASSPAINTARDALASAGIQTAALCMGGRYGGSTGMTETESYNGSTWTSVNSVNTGREYPGGAGVQTAALFIGGTNPTGVPFKGVEIWDGTCWTAGTNLAGHHSGGVTSGGITTAALIAGGGWPPPSPYYNATSETYDGTSWTEGNNMTASQGAMTGGLAFSSVPVGFGLGGSPSATFFQTYDGTCWSEGTAMSDGRDQAGAAGTNTATLAYSGNPGHQTSTESYNGTAWTELAVLATGGRAMASAGTNTKALRIAGETPPGSTKNNICEEWNDPVYTIKTVTTS